MDTNQKPVPADAIPSANAMKLRKLTDRLLSKFPNITTDTWATATGETLHNLNRHIRQGLLPRSLLSRIISLYPVCDEIKALMAYQYPSRTAEWLEHACSKRPLLLSCPSLELLESPASLSVLEPKHFGQILGEFRDFGMIRNRWLADHYEQPADTHGLSDSQLGLFLRGNQHIDKKHIACLADMIMANIQQNRFIGDGDKQQIRAAVETIKKSCGLTAPLEIKNKPKLPLDSLPLHHKDRLKHPRTKAGALLHHVRIGKDSELKLRHTESIGEEAFLRQALELLDTENSSLASQLTLENLRNWESGAEPIPTRKGSADALSVAEVLAYAMIDLPAASANLQNTTFFDDFIKACEKSAGAIASYKQEKRSANGSSNLAINPKQTLLGAAQRQSPSSHLQPLNGSTQPPGTFHR
jgi:hypothetical protein